MSVDIVGPFGQEPYYGLGHFFRLANTPHGYVGSEDLWIAPRRLLEHTRFDGTRRYGIDPNPLLRIVKCRRSRQSGDRVFAGDIW